ncbi:MAG: hypothetical protein LBP98_05600, partial [Tannerella sp.]|nr:hypothetical protein [Tannerella sp.]
KPSEFTGNVFCITKPENVRIPGYVIIFGLKECEKQTRKWMVYFLTAPKMLLRNFFLRRYDFCASLCHPFAIPPLRPADEEAVPYFSKRSVSDRH